MCPLLEKFTDAQQEHNRCRCPHITPDHRNRNGRSIKYGNFQLACQQAFQALLNITGHCYSGHDYSDRHRYQELNPEKLSDLGNKFLLILTVQTTRRVDGQELPGIGEMKP